MKIYLYLFVLVLILSSCSSGTNLNLFSIKEDKEFGKKVSDQIESEGKYKFLDSVKHAEVYGYVYKIRNEILNSGNVKHKNDFEWRIRIIEDDSTLNAFCTPGGYIYVFTGILKFLDSEDQLAGVMGHEIAHADLRHSTRQMTEMYGIQLLLELIAGDSQSVKEITSGLIGLTFSRSHEKEADANSVKYLCPTKYNAAGGAGFFEKLIQKGDSNNPPVFLSTHPDPGNRVEKFKRAKEENGCLGNETFTSEYKRIISKLP
jgi:predicted Zn-dependent protease